MAPAEEAEVPLLIFPVHGLLGVYEREAEAGEEEKEYVSLGGRLKEALVCDDGCKGACELSYRQDLLSVCAGAYPLVGEYVPGVGIVTVCLDDHGGGGRRGCLGVWDLGCL